MEQVLPGAPSSATDPATEVGIMRLRRAAPGPGVARVQLPASSIEPAAVLVLVTPFRTEPLAGPRLGIPAVASGRLGPGAGVGISGVGRLRWARCREGCLHLLASAEVDVPATAGRGEALCGRALLAASLILTDGSPAQLCLTCFAAIPGQSRDRDLAGAR